MKFLRTFETDEEIEETVVHMTYIDSRFRFGTAFLLIDEIDKIKVGERAEVLRNVSRVIEAGWPTSGYSIRQVISELAALPSSERATYQLKK